MENAIIKIKGTQNTDGQLETMELTTEGTVCAESGKIILCYEEGEMMGEYKVLTKLSASEKIVILERSGDLNSRLVIEQGVRNSCFYSVPQGELMLGIYGKEVKNNLTEHGGSLKMVYIIDSNLHPISENTVEITVKEVKN